jgi:hypothetical protein
MEAHGESMPRSQWRHLWIPAAWLLGAALVLWAAQSGPFDPARRAYGANWPGDLRRAFIELTLEVAVLYLILRPQSYAGSWKRSGPAFLVFAPWTVLGGLGTLHSGRIAAWHFGWLLVVTVALLVTTVISASVAARAPARGTA